MSQLCSRVHCGTHGFCVVHGNQSGWQAETCILMSLLLQYMALYQLADQLSVQVMFFAGNYDYTNNQVLQQQYLHQMHECFSVCSEWRRLCHQPGTVTLFILRVPILCLVQHQQKPPVHVGCLTFADQPCQYQCVHHAFTAQCAPSSLQLRCLPPKQFLLTIASCCFCIND